jgi:diguanylate cyclase (GGDEF)-like protein
LQGVNWRGLGINFQEEANFKLAQLREPQQLAPLYELVSEIFGPRDFQALSFEIGNEFVGIAVFFGQSPSADKLEYLHACRDLAQQAATVLELSKRLHAVSLKDQTTALLNRSHFMGRLSEEVARARRTQLPVSLVLIAIDQFGSMVTEFGADEGQTVLKAFARILQNHSRVNDIIGRIGSDEFGLLLPHTDKKGAAIKAERLRRMIEAADFSKVIRSQPRITISVGLSEYPTLSRDADELFQTADDALFQIREVQNKVCLAKQANGFVPDFVIEEKNQ